VHCSKNQKQNNIGSFTGSFWDSLEGILSQSKVSVCKIIIAIIAKHYKFNLTFYCRVNKRQKTISDIINRNKVTIKNQVQRGLTKKKNLNNFYYQMILIKNSVVDPDPD
jgi:hypothetical protein